MKNKLQFLMGIVIAVAMICSCHLGLGSSSGDNEPVQVSFSLASNDGKIASRIISVDGNTGLLSNATYQYKAVPQWTSEFATVQGAKSSWTNFTAGNSVGLFAQGNWTFEVQVVSANSVVLYSGTVNSYINQSVSSITVSLEKKMNGTGSVSISVSSPTVSAADKLVLSYGTVGNDTAISTENITGTSASGITSFTKSLSSLSAGLYWFKLVYNDGTNDVGGSLVQVDVIGSESTTITGTVESGVWQAETFTLTGIKTFGITVTAAGGVTSVQKNTDIVFTCSKIANSENIAAYQWHVNGEKQASATSATYTFNKANPGYYYITCVAADAASNPTLAASASKGFTVTE